MIRSSVFFRQRWRVVLAVAVLFPAGVSLVRAEEKKSPLQSSEKALAGSMARMLRIHDPNVRALMQAALKKSGGFQWPVLSPDGKNLFYTEITGGDITIYGLGVREGKVAQTYKFIVPRFNHFPKDAPPYSLHAALSPNGRLLAGPTFLGSPLRRLALLDVETGKQRLLLSEQPNTINSIAFSRDGRRLAVGDAGGGVWVYDVASGRVLSKWHYKNELKMMVVAFHQSPQGEQVMALAGQDNQLAVNLHANTLNQDYKTLGPPEMWNVDTNQLIRIFPAYTFLQDIAFSSDGKQVGLIGIEATTPPARTDVQLLLTDWQTNSSSRQAANFDNGLPVLFFTPDKRNALFVYGFDGRDFSQVFDNPLLTPSKP